MTTAFMIAAMARPVEGAIALSFGFAAPLRALDVISWLIEELAVRDFDFAFFNADDDNLEFIADFDDFARIIDVFPVKTRNVAKTISIAEEVHEGAVILDAVDRTFVDFAYLGFSHDILDHLFGFIDHIALHVIDGYIATVLDVDLDVVALGDDVIDDFSACADDVSDLVWVDGEVGHLRRVFAHIVSWGGDSSFDDFSDFRARFGGLGESFAQDFAGDAVDLDIHLKGR